MESKAKVFYNGRSQAIRLPREFRFAGSEVYIRKEGGKVILEEIQKTEWPEKFWHAFRRDENFEIPHPLPQSNVELD